MRTTNGSDKGPPAAATGSPGGPRRRSAPACRHLLGVALVVSLAMPSLAMPGAFPARAADDELVDASTSTFRAVPGKDRFDVRVDLTLTNRRPSTIRVVPCPGAPSLRCRQRISYYIDHWGYLVVQPGARRVRVTGPGVKARLAKHGEGWIGYEVRFPRLLYGQTQRLRLAYQLPSGGPRSATPTRLTDAYAHLCWHGQPTDRGSATTVLPAGYHTETYGGRVRTLSSRHWTTVRATDERGISRFWVCTDAFATDKLQRTETLSPTGQRVVVEGWPEDPSWTGNVTQDVDDTLPRLQDIIGSPLPQDDIVVRQVARQALEGYAGDYSGSRGQIRVSESLDDPALVAHELSHAWFNGATLADVWLIEGYAEWAGETAADGICSEPGEYPGKGAPQLTRWRTLGVDPSRVDRAVIEWQYATACWLVARVARLIGPERMREVTAAVLQRAPAYKVGLVPRAAHAPKPGWRQWLDAVDELGLLPAGNADLTHAEGLLVEQGVARLRDLRGRAEARAAYHEALERLDWRLPGLVGRLMGAWRFEDARTAIGLTEDTLDLLDQAGSAGAAMVDVAMLEGRLQAASSLGELRTIRDEARAALAALATPGTPGTGA
jgi:hypothetical protein